MSTIAYRVFLQNKSLVKAIIFPNKIEADVFYRENNGVFMQPASDPVPEKYLNKRNGRLAGRQTRTNRCGCGRSKLISDQHCASCNNCVI